MTTTRTLSRYIARVFAGSFVSLLVVLAGVVLLFEFVEIVRRTGNRPEVSLELAFRMTMLKLPDTVQAIFHFTVLFSAMFTFWRLTRSQELVVARAAGVSVWQILRPVLWVALAIGAFKILVFNPVSAAMYGRFELLEERYIQGRVNVLDISKGGLWLRQRMPEGVSVIYAESTAPGEVLLNNVIVFLYDSADRYTGRIDAKEAQLHPGYWELRQAWLMEGEMEPTFVDVTRLATDLTRQRIQENFASPKTLSFWALPDFISTLETTGFSATEHRLAYQGLLAQPLLLAAMVLFAAAFSLRQHRRGGALMLTIAGIGTGFTIFVLNDVVTALGLAETIPVGLAAWAPAAVGALIGTAALLHLEDG